MTTDLQAAREAIEKARDRAALGAFITLADPDQLAVTGEGPLAGVPVGVKDNLDTVDLPTSGGTPALAGSRPERDHPAVRRLRDAGAVVVGKANLHELALGITSNNAAFGPVHNPHDPGRSAGGSSGGSAAAVAAGLVPFAIGTDTGGSMRIPAAHCGVVGLRPTVGRWGTGACVPISTTRDTAGPFATSVAGVRLLDSVVSGDGAVPAPGRVRLGVPRAGFFDGLHPDVAAAVSAALDALSDSGVELVEVDLATAHELDAACGMPIVFYEIARALPEYLASLPGPERELAYSDLVSRVASPDVKAPLEAFVAEPVTDEVYRQSLTLRDQLRRAYEAALRPAGRDPLHALVYPTVPLPPPPLGDDLTTDLDGTTVPVFATSIQNTGPGSTAGMPAISLPVTPTPAGLPVGLSLEALPGQDATLLAVAEVVEHTLQSHPS